MTPESPQLRTSPQRGEEKTFVPLGARWMVFVGCAILAWIGVAPVVWICHPLLKYAYVGKALLLASFGLLYVVWNLVMLQKLLFVFYEECPPPSGSRRTRWQIVRFFVVQVVLAFVCTHLAGRVNPIGMQQWFWMPISAFAGILLTRPVQITLVLTSTSVISTLHDYAYHGWDSAMLWMLGQLTTSVFIMACCFAASQAARQRLQTVRLASELRAANAQLEMQADQAAMLAVVQERNRLAREIHDSVGHSLTVVGAQLDAAEALILQSPERALDAVQKAQRSSREGLAEIRRSVSALRASPLDERPLVESLTALIADVERPGLKLSLRQSGTLRPLPSLVEISLFRCAQEGITNACRHASASEIDLHLDFTANASVSLSVTDNGRGFSDIPESSHGLKGLRERAALLHGELTAGTSPQGGGFCRMAVPA